MGIVIPEPTSGGRADHALGEVEGRSGDAVAVKVGQAGEEVNDRPTFFAGGDEEPVIVFVGDGGVVEIFAFEGGEKDLLGGVGDGGGVLLVTDGQGLKFGVVGDEDVAIGIFDSLEAAGLLDGAVAVAG